MKAAWFWPVCGSCDEVCFPCFESRRHEHVAALYAVEEQIRDQTLKGEAQRLQRLTHSKPQVEASFTWGDRQFERQGLLPSNPMPRALAYARERRVGLDVFLTDPDVTIEARRPASGPPCRRTHAAPMETTLRRPSPALGFAQHLNVGKNAGALAVTAPTFRSGSALGARRSVIGAR